MPKTESKSALKPKQCPITLEDVTQERGVMVRVKRHDDTVIYFLENDATRKSLTVCPHTRSVGEYEYAYLKDISPELLKKIQSEDNHNNLVVLAEQVAFTKADFQKRTPARLFQYTTDSFFSNWRRGLKNGAIAGAGASAIITEFSEHMGEPGVIAHCFSTIVLSAFFGMAVGQIVDMNY